MYYLYTHIRCDRNTVFYVGIGTIRRYGKKYSRAFDRKNRNQHWKNIAKFGYSIQVIAEFETRKEAEEAEIALIWYYGRKDKGEGELVNYTDGGGGIVGYSHSEEARRKMRENTSGKPKSESHKQKLREANIGRKASEETKAKLRGRIHTEKHKAKVRAALIGRPVSTSTRDKMREIHKSRVKDGKHNSARPVINIVTGEKFASIKDAAESLGVSPLSLRLHLNGRRKSKFPIYYEGGETSEAKIERSKFKETRTHSQETKDKIAAKLRGKPGATKGRAKPYLHKPIINYVSGKVYESIKQAAEMEGHNPSTLSSKLLGYAKNNTPLRYKNQFTEVVQQQ